jgi:hypothetical protein
VEDEYVANALISKNPFDSTVTPDLITSLCETLSLKKKKNNDKNLLVD